jgi:hypothetical protein
MTPTKDRGFPAMPIPRMLGIIIATLCARIESGTPA